MASMSADSFCVVSGRPLVEVAVPSARMVARTVFHRDAASRSSSLRPSASCARSRLASSHSASRCSCSKASVQLPSIGQFEACRGMSGENMMRLITNTMYSRTVMGSFVGPEISHSSSAARHPNSCM